MQEAAKALSGDADQTNGYRPEQTEIDRRQLQIEALYVTHAGLAHIKPPAALIEGWLYQNSLAWLSGKPGDGKSFIALDMAYSVATGVDWQGHSVQQGAALYIAAEGATGLSIRANAWVAAHAHGNPDSPPVVYLPLAINLKDTDQIDVRAFSQALVALKPSLVIIDTQARVTTGAEENSSKDMGRFVDALEHLRAANPATYLTVHHTPRNGDNLRGSTALEGAADTVLRSVKEGEIITLECRKQKNAAETEDLQMYMEPIGDSIVLSREAVGLIESNTKSQDQLLKCMLDLYGTDEVGATELLEASGMGKQTFYNAVNPLVKRGKVIKRESGRSKWYRLP